MIRSISYAVAAMVATAFFSPALALAQTPTPAPAPATPSGTRQSLTIQSIWRRYDVGDTRVREQAAPLLYRVTSDAITLRLSLTPVNYRAGDTSISGTTPFAARFDYRFANGDTVRFYGESASAPRTLNALQTDAIGDAGTPTLDLDSLSLGVSSTAGARVDHQMLTGSILTSVYGALEVQPEPGGTDPAYWRGTTLKGGATFTGPAAAAELSATVEASRSFAGSLDGRNLFPGGGTISLSANGNGPLGSSATDWQVFTFYFRPINLSRADQPNRLIPVGDFMGVHGSLSIPAGSLLVWPSVSISREASHTVSQEDGVTSRLEGSGWASSAGLEVSIPAGNTVDFTPSVGYVFGAVGASSTITAPPPPSTESIRDRIRGWYIGFEVWIRRG